MKVKNVKLISWTGVFFGAFVGVGLNFLLNLFALSIGLASFTVDSTGKTLFTLPGFIGFCITSCIAMFFSGWIAGKLTPVVLNKVWGLLIGFLAWSMLLIFTIILLTNMIQYSAFHANFTSNLVAIKITHSSPMLTETTAQSIKKSPLSFNIETAKKEIVLNALLTFLLFLQGAVASALGGFIGYRQSVYRIKA